MSSRISKQQPTPIILLLLAGCGADADLSAPDTANAPRIACAVGGESTFSNSCTLSQDGDLLTLTAPDGGFRRLRIIAGGVKAADGAEPALITPLNDMIEVRIGDDAYRLPAQVR